MPIMKKFLELEKDKTSKEVMTPAKEKEEKHYVRSLGNVTTAAEAQRIFNPNLPPTKPKGPTAAQVEKGSTSAMDVQGTWGKAERSE